MASAQMFAGLLVATAASLGGQTAFAIGT